MTKLTSKILFILIAIFGLSSCAHFKLAELQPIPKNKELLPTLTPKVDIASLESAYTLGATATSTYGATSTNVNKGKNSANLLTVGAASSTSVAIADPRIQDIISIFDKDVKDNITDAYNEPSGYMVLRIDASKKKSGMGWAVLSGMTLCIPNLLGMPIDSYTTELAITVEIYNNKDILVGKYDEISKNKMWTALYWSHNTDLARRTNIYAFREAMEKIKIKIENDYERLIDKLK